MPAARACSTPAARNWFFAAEGEPGSVVSDLTVTRNTVVEGAPPSANTVADGGLATTIRLARRQRVAFTDNSTSVPGHGPVLFFGHVDGLLVRGNVQPLVSGSVTWFRDCTAVEIEDRAPST